MITRSEAIKQLRLLKADIINGLSFISKTKDKHPALDSLDMAIKSLETDEAYQLEYESTTKNDLVTLTFSKGTLKYSCKDYVVYKKDWLRSHYGAEIDIMFGDSQYNEPTTKNDLGVDREEAIETLKENLCAMCAYGSQCMESCDIKSCDNRDAIKALEQEPCGDCISRTEAIKCLECDFDITGKENMKTVVNYINSAHNKIVNLPSVQPDVTDNNVGELTIHCKDCKFFEYDHVENVGGVPLIVGHEVCTKWGDGCKTNENGACFLAERKESEDKE